MTVCGFRNGFAWADSEIYSDDEPTRESIDKLAVSAGGLVGVGTGRLVLVREFRCFVAALGRAPFALALARLPAQLRQMRDELRTKVHGFGQMQSTFALCGIGAIGFRGAVFAEANAFEPIERESWSSPHVDQYVSSAADVLEFAQAQIRYVQITSPTATGRELTIARLLGSARVERVSIRLLLDHERPGIGDSLAHERARLVEIEARRW